MKYKTQGNCPYCDSEICGYSGGWAMSPCGFAEMKRKHDLGHPENEPILTTSFKQVSNPLDPYEKNL